MNVYAYFLLCCRSVLNRSVGFAQLLGRGDTLRETGVLLYYAQTLGDFEQALGQLVNEGKLRAAITILDDANIEKGTISLSCYIFIHVFLFYVYF